MLDLAALLRGQVEAFRHTHLGIKFHLENLDTAPVYADATLIQEGIGNLLSNAASCRGDSTVKVALCIEGSMATISVTNKDPAVQSDTEMLFGPFASTRSGPSSEHHGIGLYLVRLIAEQHGGSASICNLADGSGVKAKMSIASRPRNRLLGSRDEARGLAFERSSPFPQHVHPYKRKDSVKSSLAVAVAGTAVALVVRRADRSRKSRP